MNWYWLSNFIDNFTSLGKVLPTNKYPSGEGNIFFDDVECEGTETNLFDCPSRGLNVHNCEHHEDAGVQCFSKSLSHKYSL